MMMRYIWLVLISIFAFTCLSAGTLSYQDVIRNLRGVREFDKENYEEAERYFRDNALKNPREGNIQYNLGNLHYKKGDFDAAQNAYELALRDDDFANKADAFHNLGNIYFNEQDYEKAIQHYRDAILQDPNHADARYNYELVSRFLEREQDHPSQSEDSDNDEEQEEEEQQQEQPPSPGEDQQDEEQQQQQEEIELEKLDEEEAEKLLQSLIQREKDDLELEKEMSAPEIPQRDSKWW
jgi:tetratricopeptide (TPR) repeat protein